MTASERVVSLHCWYYILPTPHSPHLTIPITRLAAKCEPQAGEQRWLVKEKEEEEEEEEKKKYDSNNNGGIPVEKRPGRGKIAYLEAKLEEEVFYP